MTTDTRIERMLALSESYLRDAVAGQCSTHSRASAAFDAGYIALLTRVPRERSAAVEHPSVELLREGCARLRVDPAPAERFDAQRYGSDPVAGHVVAELVQWAKRVRGAVG